MQRDVLRYKYPTDQKARVLARLMLLKSMIPAGQTFLTDGKGIQIINLLLKAGMLSAYLIQESWSYFAMHQPL
jgi:hypothetical protein